MDKSIKDLIIKWNNTFPLDNWYRMKYSIPFNSKKHRETNQADIYWEWVEQKEFIELEKKELLDKDLKLEDYLKPKMTQEELNKQEMDLFDKLDIEKIQI